MEIGRTPAGLPPAAREEMAERLKNGRGGISGGDPGTAERRAAAERAAADRDAARSAGLQTVEAVGRAVRPDMTEPARDAAAPRSPMERGARLDLRV